MMRREHTTHRLVSPAGDGYYYKCAYYRRPYYRHPLSLDQPQIVNETYPGRHEKESEILDKKVSDLIDPEYTHHAGAQSGREEQHADDARRNGDTRKPYNKLADSQKSE